MFHYPHLFEPVRVRNVYIKNRIESAPMSPSEMFLFTPVKHMKCTTPLQKAEPES